MIKFEHVWKSYDNHHALRNVNFHVEPGEMVFITGHSGAGKSTLFRLIGLMEKSTRGTIKVADKDVSQLPKHFIPHFRRRIGMVFQDPMLLNDLSVIENVALPMKLAGLDHKALTYQANEALECVDLLDKANEIPSTLSTGECQRIGLARSIALKPKILLADEPTGNLDPELSEKIFKLLMQFNESGTTVLVATHDTHLIKRFDYKRIRLNQGLIV